MYNHSNNGCIAWLALSEETIETSNKTVIWTWDAVQNGSMYDCRLCLETRLQPVRLSCQNQCSEVPTEILETKRMMKEQWKKDLDNAIKWLRVRMKKQDEEMRKLGF